MGASSKLSQDLRKVVDTLELSLVGVLRTVLNTGMFKTPMARLGMETDNTRFVEARTMQ